MKPAFAIFHGASVKDIQDDGAGDAPHRKLTLDAELLAFVGEHFGADESNCWKLSDIKVIAGAKMAVSSGDICVNAPSLNFGRYSCPFDVFRVKVDRP